MRGFGWLGVAGALLLGVCSAGAQGLTADQIVWRMLERNAQRQSMLRHYASDRMYRLEYTGIGGEHHAEMRVHAEYTAPGRKHFTILAETGSKVLGREVLRKLVDAEEETSSKPGWQREMFSPETYNLRLLGLDVVEGISTWVLAVEPKTDSKVGYSGKVWISMDDFATVRMVAEPAKSPNWMLSGASFDARYMRRGEVWVPERNVSTTHVRIGGDARVTIDYGEYVVLTTAPVKSANGSNAANGSSLAGMEERGRPSSGAVMSQGLR